MNIIESFEILLKACQTNFNNHLMNAPFNYSDEAVFGLQIEKSDKIITESLGMLESELTSLIGNILKLYKINNRCLNSIEGKCINYIKESYIWTIDVAYAGIMDREGWLNDKEVNKKYTPIKEKIIATINFMFEQRRQENRKASYEIIWDIVKMIISAIVGGLISRYIIK